MEKRKTIQELASAYQERFDAVQAKQDEIAEGKVGGSVVIPSYKDEVVIPIITMLRKEMGDKKIKIPASDTYHLQGGLFRIKVGTTVVGGLSYPIKEDHRVYYTRLFRQQNVGERVEITSVKQLADIIREQLKEKKDK